MHKDVFNYLSQFSKNTKDVDELIVSAFLEFGGYPTPTNLLLKQYDIRRNSTDKVKVLNEFINHIEKKNDKLIIEDLIELFEFVISPADKEVNGAVYTPVKIRNTIVGQTISKLEKKGVNISTAIFGDIACGCGGFFYTIAEVLHEKYKKSFSEIFRDNIVGLDIEDYSITRTKLLLSILALTNGEDQAEYNWNLFVGDALQFNWNNECEKIANNGGFHAIVGNPPYVGAVKLDAETKKLLKKWEVAKVGKADLYIPFFQIGLENLSDSGVLGFISVNSFYKSLNGIGLRKYFSENKFDLSIIDFGGEQIFKGRTTYTCICIIQKIETASVHYTKTFSKDIDKLKMNHYVNVAYDKLNNEKGWLLDKVKIASQIRKIENIGKSLKDSFEIRNGFATLRNKIYIISPSREDRDYFYVTTENGEFKIEKSICKIAIKPNIIKVERDIEENLEYIIFPYHLIEEENDLFEEKKTVLKLFEESYFRTNFPRTYDYLKFFKNELAKRDNGNKTYENWYAYGRNQGLKLKGKKLLFPYISDHPYFVFTNEENLLFYNGFAVISNDELELKFIQRILNSRLFWFYLSHVSRPYENGYYSMGKRYLSRFGIHQFTESEKEKLRKMTDLNKIDDFIEKKYGIVPPPSFIKEFKLKRKTNVINKA